MTFVKVLGVVLFAVLGLIALPGRLVAADTPGGVSEATPPSSPPTVAGIPPELVDPSFDQYVNMAMLASAWDQLDAPLMTDVALQLAEGERILQRSHKAISARKMTQLACVAAIESHDQDSLDRLRKAALRLRDKQLGSEISTAAKLASQTRDATSQLTVAIDSLSAQQYADLKTMLVAIRAVRFTGDAKVLDRIEKTVDDTDWLSEQQKTHVKRQIADTRAAVSQAAHAAKAHAEAAGKLSAITRSFYGKPKGGKPPGSQWGGGGSQWGGQFGGGGSQWGGGGSQWGGQFGGGGSQWGGGGSQWGGQIGGGRPPGGQWGGHMGGHWGGLHGYR